MLTAGPRIFPWMQAFLWIMRHGMDDCANPERPLLPIGQKAADAAGIALDRLKTPIQACLASPVLRAQQTAERVCGHLDLEPLTLEALSGPPVDIQQIVAGRGNCLVISHSASLSAIVRSLTGAQMLFYKAGLAQIHEGELWTALRPSQTMAMAGMKFDPMEVDVRDDGFDVDEPLPRWLLP